MASIQEFKGRKHLSWPKIWKGYLEVSRYFLSPENVHRFTADKCSWPEACSRSSSTLLFLFSVGKTIFHGSACSFSTILMTQVLSLSADTARWSVLAALADTIILTGNWGTASRAAPTTRQMPCPQTSAQQDILPTAFFQSSNDAGSRQLTPENGTWSWTTGIPPTAGSLAETKMRVRVYSCSLVSDQTGEAIGLKPALKGLLKKAYAAIICSGYARCLQRKKVKMMINAQ